MTPSEPPSNPYDPNWPKPEQPDDQGQPEQPGRGPAEPTNPYAQGQPTQPGWGQPQSPDPSSPYPPYGQAPPSVQAPYGQAPYGQAPYGQAPYGPGTPAHPSATTAMVLGIGALAGMFICGIPIVLAPFAWMIGGRAVKEIDANPGRYSGREQAQAGRIMGMIGTALLVLITLAVIAFVTLAFAVSDSSDLSYDPGTDSYSYDSSL